jgi:hypothetical protein
MVRRIAEELNQQIRARTADRTKAITEAVRDVAALVEARRFDEAQRLLDAAIRQYGEDDALVRARAGAIAAARFAGGRQKALAAVRNRRAC